MAKQNATHEVHQSSDGRYRWVDDGRGGVWKHDQRFYGAARDAHPESQGGQHVPLPMVVLRCRCDDPASHAGQGQHCPAAEIDVAESLVLSTSFDEMNP